MADIKDLKLASEYKAWQASNALNESTPPSAIQEDPDVAFMLALPKRGAKYAHLFLRASRDSGIPAPIIAAIAQSESNYNPEATNPDGAYTAYGMMQIYSKYHKEFLDRVGDDWSDPWTNIEYGVMSVLLPAFKFFQKQADPDRPGDPRPLSGGALLTASIAAYNGGQSGVLKALCAGKHPDTRTENNYTQKVRVHLDAILTSLSAYPTFASALYGDSTIPYANVERQVGDTVLATSRAAQMSTTPRGDFRSENFYVKYTQSASLDRKKSVLEQMVATATQERPAFQPDSLKALEYDFVNGRWGDGEPV